MTESMIKGWADDMSGDRIILPAIPVLACHGVYEEEKHQPQPFMISLILWLDLAPAAASGQVGDTVDYGRLYNQVKELAENNSFNLIETLAERIAALALAEAAVRRVRVGVEKSQARSGGAVFPAQVVVERRR